MSPPLPPPSPPRRRQSHPRHVTSTSNQNAAILLFAGVAATIAFVWVPTPTEGFRSVLPSFVSPSSSSWVATTTTRQPQPPRRRSAFSPLHMAKKKKKNAKKRSASGQGFGKATEEPPTPKKQPPPSTAATLSSSSSPPQPMAPPSASQQAEGALTSIEKGGSTAIPAMEGETSPVSEAPTLASTSAPPQASAMVNPDLSAEDRAKKILREKYGFTSFQEQELQKKVEKDQEKRMKWQERAKPTSASASFDIMKSIPAPILVAIDRFLKIGVTISIILFVAAGIGITVEAWSVSTGTPIPDEVRDFVVNVVEPSFTPGLVVLLGFSVSLGVFAYLQLESGASQYQEGPK